MQQCACVERDINRTGRCEDLTVYTYVLQDMQLIYLGSAVGRVCVWCFFTLDTKPTSAAWTDVPCACDGNADLNRNLLTKTLVCKYNRF